MKGYFTCMAVILSDAYKINDNDLNGYRIEFCELTQRQREDLPLAD